MVAIRRAPGPPHSNSEESDSSATVTSSSKAKAPNHAPERPSPLANGQSRGNSHDGLREDGSRDTGDSRAKRSKVGRTTKKGGKKRKHKNANSIEVLLRYLLLFFTIYSLSACPGDAELKSPVCRGLSEYRRLILEPYIFPTVNKALSHPSILPYVDRAMPYANQAVRIARPVVSRMQLEWNHRIVPQWNKVIIPQYDKYLTPQLVRASGVIQPYLSAVEEKYEALLGPYRRVIISTGNKYQRAARPYIVMVANRTYSVYQTTRPYLCLVWQRITHTLKQLLIFLRAQRRQFVDPHVARIWERVKELSRGGDESVTSQSLSVQSTYLATVEVPVESPVVQGLSAKPVEVEPTSSPASAPTSSSSVSSRSSVPLPISTAVSQPEPSVGIAEELAFETFSSASSSPVESIPVKDHTPLVEETTLLPTAAPSSTPAIMSPLDDDVDLEAFYADIGLTDEEPVAGALEEDVQTENPPLDEEQLEGLRLEELAKTAKKRHDITSRHTKWEEKLEIAIEEKKKTLRKALVTLRKAAVQNLKTNNHVHSAIEQLVESAEKFLKGAEAYLNNLKIESRVADEKVASWTKVLAKVDAKFTEHLRQTEDVVNKWYTTHLEKEMQQVMQVAEEVREIAENAQADLGYDYVWLGDVTYQDWQRYHALVGRSNNFTELAKSIQNGSHSSPPIDPIPDALHDLQLELEDVITGFETRFRRIKRNGFKAFNALPGDTTDEEEIEHGSESPPSPEVSILPIPGDEPSPAQRDFQSELPVIARGKEEVEEAFVRAEAELDREHSQEVEGTSTTADETDEVEHSLASPPPVGHEEL